MPSQRFAPESSALRHTMPLALCLALAVGPAAACSDDAAGSDDTAATLGDGGDSGGGLQGDSAGDPDAAASGSDGVDGAGIDGDDTGDDANEGDGGSGGSDSSAGCPGQPGCACADNTECDNNICIDMPEGKRCATTCVDSCDKGYTCKNVGSGDVLFVCVPDYLTLCSPCQTTADCTYQGSEALCLDYGAHGKFCGGPCKADGDCPTASDGATYACVEVLDAGSGALTKQCRLQTSAGAPAICACTVWAKAAAKKTTCSVANDAGSCQGERQCGAAGMSACSAKTPAAESCNGLDDDCDGATDALPASKSCSKSAWLPLGSQATCTVDGDCSAKGESCNPGNGLCQQLVGTCVGKAACEGGVEVCKDVKTPKAEACNGDDDDCDGTADEDFAWTHPVSGASVPVGGACGVGPCAGGLVACETQLAAICTTAAKAKSETCNGSDDDCDGATDDGACDDGDACTGDVCDPKAAACSNPAAVGCDDKNPCTADSCDKKAGACVYKALQASCDDGDACTVGDACSADAVAVALCLPGKTTKDCDDSNPCTDDSCAADKGCVQLPNAATEDCYDGAKGTAGVGTCVGGVRACAGGKLSGSCVGQILPAKVEACDGKDDGCDGGTDEGCKAAAVDGGFAAASALLAGGKTAPGVRVVLGDGNVAGGAVSGGGKAAGFGFVAWLRALFE